MESLAKQLGSLVGLVLTMIVVPLLVFSATYASGWLIYWVWPEAVKVVMLLLAEAIGSVMPGIFFPPLVAAIALLVYLVKH